MALTGRLLAGLFRALLRLRYRVRLEGEDAVLARGRSGILLLPNHPALVVDPLILVTWLFPRFGMRSIADRDQIAPPGVRSVAKALQVVPIPDPLRYGEAARGEVDRVLQACAEGLRRGENWLLYPSGRVYRSRLEDLGGNSAVARILAEVPQARVVVVRSEGLWGSAFSYAGGTRPDLGRLAVRILRWLAANLMVFGPRRPVTLTLEEAEGLPAEREALNRALEARFNRDAPPARHVPHTWFEGGGIRDLPEPGLPRLQGDAAAVPASIRETVLAWLREASGHTDIRDHELLARDLGLDSLARMELLVRIASEFGQDVQDPEALQTAGDVMLAAAGQSVAGTGRPIPPPSPRWFQGGAPPRLAPGETVPEVFLRQARLRPTQVVLADASGGLRTYRDILTAILALQPRLRALEGDFVGLMLPASSAASVTYLALLFAGKTPVMVNWTVGSRSLHHGLGLLGVRTVLTSEVLLARLEAQGVDLGGRDQFLALEDLGRSLSTRVKLVAALRARLGAPGLGRARTADPAVVLFTSGSESLPKAVPLTHGNLLANLRDVQEVLHVASGDRMIGFLPPFHSFGLTGTVLLPLLAGLPVVYHPNPTEGAALARIVDAYGVTLLVGTPTFLAGIVRAAPEGGLSSLRLVVTGAERCPEALWDTLGARWPHLTLLEGYGITECSPVVSVNRPERPQPGSIGPALPSVEWALVDPDSGAPVAPGRPGMLLVRGPSIFEGYLRHDGPSPFQEHGGRTWYRTGDLVREAQDGSLIFCGRLKRFVKLGGEMVSLPAVEEALLARFAGGAEDGPLLAVEATAADATPELVLFTTGEVTREEANAVLKAAGLSPLHFIRQVRRVDAIPVLGTGKTDYRALKALLG